MPIYEYRCENCGEALEKIQKISDPPLLDCPNCGQPTLKKQLSAAGFRLKGGGWYETDFKKSNQKNLHDSGEKTAATAVKTESNNTSSTNSAPAATPIKPAA